MTVWQTTFGWATDEFVVVEVETGRLLERGETMRAGVDYMVYTEPYEELEVRAVPLAPVPHV